MSSLSPEAAAGVRAGPCYSRFLPTQALFRAVLSFGRVGQPTTNPWERLTSSGKPKCSRSGNLKPAIVPWNFPRAFWAAKSRRWLLNIFNDFSWDAFFKMLSACWLFKPQRIAGLLWLILYAPSYLFLSSARFSQPIQLSIILQLLLSASSLIFQPFSWCSALV